MTDQRFDVEHRREESRYVLVDREHSSGHAAAEIGEEQYVEFSGEKPLRIFYHTAVSEDYGGQGLASKLVRAAVDQAVAEGFGVVPVCPYVGKWFEKHPEYAEHAVQARPEHLAAVQNRHG